MPVAQLLADGDDVSISGPHADWVNPDLAIVDPGTAKRITRVDGAERWARLLPFGYRSGDLHVKVTEIDRPSRSPRASATPPPREFVPRTAVSEIHAKVVGREPKDTRQALGLTQAKVAERLEVSPSYLSAVEAGRRNLTPNPSNHPHNHPITQDNHRP